MTVPSSTLAPTSKELGFTRARADADYRGSLTRPSWGWVTGYFAPPVMVLRKIFNATSITYQQGIPIRLHFPKIRITRLLLRWRASADYADSGEPTQGNGDPMY